jgi:imidazolonepropionase-like amidohydrolase
MKLVARLDSSVFRTLLACGAAACAPASQSGLFIRNVNVIDGTGGGPREEHVFIEGDEIRAVGSDLEEPPGATLIDGTGRWLIPGIIDTHTHLDAPMVFQISVEEKEAILAHTGHALLYNGVTTVLNLSSDADWIWERRAGQREGRWVSPRIYAMGRSFTPEGGWGSRHGSALTDAAAARTRALDYAAQGADGFKIVLEDGLGASGTYTEMADEMLNAVVEVAREKGLPVYVHAINLHEYRRAVAIRPRAIVHGLEDPVPEGDPILQDLVRHGVAVAPTLSLFESFVSLDGKPGAFEDPVLEASVPGFLLERMRSVEYMKEEKRRFQEVARMDVYPWAREKIPVFKDNVRRMHEAGVKLAVGTDAGGRVGYNFQGYNTPREIELLVECGLSPMEALVAATRSGAEVVGVPERLGTIEPGKWADLLILSANLLEDIRNVRRIDRIVLGGKLYPREDFAYRSR